MKKILLLALAISACAIANAQETKYYSSLRIFQALNNIEGDKNGIPVMNSWGLAKDDNTGQTYMIYSWKENYKATDMFYDGKTLSGSYVYFSVYRYEAMDDSIRTVPCLMRRSEYDRCAYLFSDRFNGFLNAVITTAQKF